MRSTDSRKISPPPTTATTTTNVRLTSSPSPFIKSISQLILLIGVVLLLIDNESVKLANGQLEAVGAVLSVVPVTSILATAGLVGVKLAAFSRLLQALGYDNAYLANNIGHGTAASPIGLQSNYHYAFPYVPGLNISVKGEDSTAFKNLAGQQKQDVKGGGGKTFPAMGLPGDYELQNRPFRGSETLKAIFRDSGFTLKPPHSPLPQQHHVKQPIQQQQPIGGIKGNGNSHVHLPTSSKTRENNNIQPSVATPNFDPPGFVSSSPPIQQLQQSPPNSVVAAPPPPPPPSPSLSLPIAAPESNLLRQQQQQLQQSNQLLASSQIADQPDRHQVSPAAVASAAAAAQPPLPPPPAASQSSTQVSSSMSQLHGFTAPIIVEGSQVSASNGGAGAQSASAVRPPLPPPPPPPSSTSSWSSIPSGVNSAQHNPFSHHQPPPPGSVQPGSLPHPAASGAPPTSTASAPTAQLPLNSNSNPTSPIVNPPEPPSPAPKPPPPPPPPPARPLDTHPFSHPNTGRNSRPLGVSVVDYNAQSGLPLLPQIAEHQIGSGGLAPAAGPLPSLHQFHPPHRAPKPQPPSNPNNPSTPASPEAPQPSSPLPPPPPSPLPPSSPFGMPGGPPSIFSLEPLPEVHSVPQHDYFRQRLQAGHAGVSHPPARHAANRHQALPTGTLIPARPAPPENPPRPLSTFEDFVRNIFGSSSSSSSSVQPPSTATTVNPPTGSAVGGGLSANPNEMSTNIAPILPINSPPFHDELEQSGWTTPHDRHRRDTSPSNTPTSPPAAGMSWANRFFGSSARQQKQLPEMIPQQPLEMVLPEKPPNAPVESKEHIRDNFGMPAINIHPLRKKRSLQFSDLMVLSGR